MKILPDMPDTSDDHLGCFGNFNLKDKICTKHCILSLRCSIDREQKVKLEMLEELFIAEEVTSVIQ